MILFPFSSLQKLLHQTKFGARCRAWNVAPYNAESTPVIAIRFEEELSLPEDLSTIVDKKSVANFFERKLNVKVTDFKLPSIQMSTVIGLADLAEDEVITPPIPMNVELENIKINVIEDRPPVNITSPGPQPINVAIGRMTVVRDASGVFQIQPVEGNSGTVARIDDPTWQKKEKDREILSLQLVMQQLKVDNDQLRRQASSAEKNMEVNRWDSFEKFKIARNFIENFHSQRIKQENDVLKSYLKAAQDDVGTLLDEKRTLMDTIKSLQVKEF